jgi:uncharacterized protein YegP (UPF0339 family)
MIIKNNEKGKMKMKIKLTIDYLNDFLRKNKLNGEIIKENDGNFTMSFVAPNGFVKYLYSDNYKMKINAMVDVEVLKNAIEQIFLYGDDVNEIFNNYVYDGDFKDENMLKPSQMLDEMRADDEYFSELELVA